MVMARVPLAIAAFAIASASVAGCTGGSNAPHGTLSGIFLMVGGPAGPADPSGVRIPLPGRVIATASSGERFAVSTGNSGRFTMLLPPGTYHLTGYSPKVHVNGSEMRCVGMHSVRVKTGEAMPGSDVYCSVP
jgi:hypothetical protein